MTAALTDLNVITNLAIGLNTPSLSPNSPAVTAPAPIAITDPMPAAESEVTATDRDFSYALCPSGIGSRQERVDHNNDGSPLPEHGDEPIGELRGSVFSRVLRFLKRAVSCDCCHGHDQEEGEEGYPYSFHLYHLEHHLQHSTDDSAGSF
ncbi:hypothetical protein BX616_000319, partial [Lobosporangium transversale]